jgi:hypothetical protein
MTSGPSSICERSTRPAEWERKHGFKKSFKKSKWTNEAILRYVCLRFTCVCVSIHLTTYFLFETRKRLPPLAAGLATGPAPGLLALHPRNRRRVRWAKALNSPANRCSQDAWVCVRIFVVSGSRQREREQYVDSFTVFQFTDYIVPDYISVTISSSPTIGALTLVW